MSVRLSTTSTPRPGKRPAPRAMPTGRPISSASKELVRHSCAVVERIFRSSGSDEKIRAIAFWIAVPIPTLLTETDKDSPGEYPKAILLDVQRQIKRILI